MTKCLLAIAVALGLWLGAPDAHAHDRYYFSFRYGYPYPYWHRWGYPYYRPYWGYYGPPPEYYGPPPPAYYPPPREPYCVQGLSLSTGWPDPMGHPNALLLEQRADSARQRLSIVRPWVVDISPKTRCSFPRSVEQ